MPCRYHTGHTAEERFFRLEALDPILHEALNDSGVHAMTESKKGCPNCDGQGYYEIGPAGWVICSDCKGTGGH